MDKHEFYKQLMSEYSFDTEKIRTNAKKGRYARQKISPMVIGFTAAVAVCTVACGTLAFSMFGSKGGVDLVDTGAQSLSALTSSERVRYAIEQQNKEQNSEVVHDVLVTFVSPLPSAQAKAVIVDYTDVSIPVKAVYLADGGKISGAEQVEAVFGGDYDISALCIQCAGSAMSQLQMASEVFLVELMSESDIDTATPMTPDAMQAVDTVIPDISPSDDDIPQQTTTGGITIVIPDDEEITGGDIIPDADDNDDANTDADTSVPEDSDTGDNTEASEPNGGETSEPDELPAENPQPIEPVEPVIPSEQPAEIATLPEGVVLPASPEPYAYDVELIGVQNAFFLTDDIFYASTEEEICLYNFSGANAVRIFSMECINPVVHWIDDDGGRLLVSSIGENGMRNKLWLVDSHSEAAFDLKAEDTVMDGTLAGVGYNEESEVLILNVKQYGEYYVAALSLSSTEAEYINVPFETKAKVSLLGYYGGNVYLAVSDGSLTQIYAVDVYTDKSRIIRTYDNSPKISKNYALTYAVISPSDTAVTGRIEIFDPKTEDFIITDYFDETLFFGASKTSFYTPNGVFAIADGVIRPINDIAELAKIDYTKSFSDSYCAAVVDGKVRITESVYSAVNMAAKLEWDSVESDCSKELWAAFEGAVGVNNALAEHLCAQSGIADNAMLIDVISLYYTDSAAQKLCALCGVSNSVRLNYTGGGLSKLRADRTKLVITDNDGATAVGNAYVRIGSVCGKSAYRVIDVQFTNDNGSWKLDTVIGK